MVGWCDGVGGEGGGGEGEMERKEEERKGRRKDKARTGKETKPNMSRLIFHTHTPLGSSTEGAPPRLPVGQRSISCSTCSYLSICENHI